MVFNLKLDPFHLLLISLFFLLLSCGGKEYHLDFNTQLPVANFSSRSVSYTGGATSVSITTSAAIDKSFPRFKAMLESSLLDNDIQVYARSFETDSIALHLQINQLIKSTYAQSHTKDEFSSRYFYAHKDSKAFIETSAFEYFGIYQKSDDYYTVAIPSDTYFIEASLFDLQKQLLAKTIIKIQSLACLKNTFSSTVQIFSQKDMQAKPHWDTLQKQNLEVQSLKCLAAHTALSLKEKRPQIFKVDD
jgi:hypothetical protein